MLGDETLLRPVGLSLEEDAGAGPVRTEDEEVDPEVARVSMIEGGNDLSDGSDTPWLPDCPIDVSLSVVPDLLYPLADGSELGVGLPGSLNG